MTVTHHIFCENCGAYQPLVIGQTIHTWGHRYRDVLVRRCQCKPSRVTLFPIGFARKGP